MPRIVFITNICTHYVIRLFELLSGKYDMVYFFTGGHETYWEKKNRLHTGQFRGEYLKGPHIGGVKITLGLWPVAWGRWDLFIKTLDDKFALPLIVAVAKLRRKPLILWTGLWHHPATKLHRFTFGLTRWIYRQADAIVVYGEHVKRYLAGIGIDPQKIFIAPHAVDNTLFNIRVNESEWHSLKKELGLDGKFVVLYVGRLEPCKGLDVLMEALAGWGEEDVALLVVGRGSLRAWLEERARQYGLAVRFCDYVENTELYRFYAISDVFVLPSVTTPDFKEPWGLVVNEAMNQNRPVIATDAVGAAAGGLVEDGQNGFIVPEQDARALGKAIHRLYDDPALTRRMGQTAGAKIEEWTQEKMCEGFVRAIEFVMKGKVSKNDASILQQFSAQHVKFEGYL